MPGHNGEHPGPLFEKPLDRVLKALSFDDKGLLRQRYDHPLKDTSILRDELKLYLSAIEALTDKNEFLDIKLARRIYAQCEALLDGLHQGAPEESKRLVQTAIGYFVEADDAECDTTSPIGFDDDAEVIEAVAREIAREDVLDLGGEDA